MSKYGAHVKYSFYQPETIENSIQLITFERIKSCVFTFDYVDIERLSTLPVSENEWNSIICFRIKVAVGECVVVALKFICESFLAFNLIREIE